MKWSENPGIAPVSGLGALLAVMGGIGYFITLLLHGDLPDQTVEQALLHIAGRPEWRLLKLSFILSTFCWIGAFIAVKEFFSNAVSRLLATWAFSIAVVGVSAMVVEYAVIGHAVKKVADAWVIASGAEADAKVRIAEVMLAISGGLFHSFVAWLLGMPFVVIGLAFLANPSSPRWLGWIAVVAGTGALVAGVTNFLGVMLVPYSVLYGAFVVPLTLWLPVAGVYVWRQLRRTTGFLDPIPQIRKQNVPQERSNQ